jgi:hypothetical protein
MPPKRWILVAASALSLVFVAWAVVSFLDDDSILSVVARDLKKDVCWSADSSTACVVKAMAKYEKRGRYDDAIRAGTAWTEKHPDGPMSGWIYRDLSVLYMKKAKMDTGHAEEYLKQALVYRDRALPSESDSPYSLLPLEAISELVGDLSRVQRCVQYGNSIKLLDRMNVLVNEDKARWARQIKPDLAQRKQIDCLSDWIDVAMRRVSSKSAVSGCQQKRSSGG